MTKEWGIRKGLNPIFYLSDNSIIPNLIRNFILKNIPADAINLLFSNELSPNTTLQLMKFLKPLRGRMKVNGTEVTKNFDEECEWRYTPTSDENSPFQNFLPNIFSRSNEDLLNSNAITKKRFTKI